MKRSNRKRDHPEEVVATLKQARPMCAATTLTLTHHPSLPCFAASAPSGFRPKRLGFL